VQSVSQRTQSVPLRLRESAFTRSIRAVILFVIKFVVFHFAGSIVKQITGKELKNNEVNEVCVWGVTRLLSTEVVLSRKLGKNEVFVLQNPP
jgi:hypothetical protein